MHFTLQQIDTKNSNVISELNHNDECHYLGDYVSGEWHHPMTSFILDFKSKSDHFRYANKGRAIQQLARVLSGINLEDFTIVPVPPSKAKNDPLYDDRLVRTLKAVESIKGCALDVRELVTQNQSYEASHDSARLRKNRPTSWDLMSRYRMADIPADELKDTIIIFDDVITKGSHFKAIQRLLSEKYPDKNIIGLFIAQTYFHNR